MLASQAAAGKVAEAERAPLQASAEEASRKLATAEREKRQMQEQLDKLIASATSGLPVEGVFSPVTMQDLTLNCPIL